ncbi:hypothetical protein [Pedobacter aquatilis]|uniref:hypothetical protein n=1 Tax=Pedobacter aquatilis TaxID=351343 RepID=UPI0029319535|nr:hypothetical protein [Pedobacter aquatilis]
MTELTARKLFNTLYRTLDNNGFKEEIATFLIGQKSNELISDSGIAMNQLYNIAQNPSQSKYALYILTEAINTYFNRAKRIPELYRERLGFLYQFTDEQPDLSLVLDDELTTRRVDVAEALNPPELKRFLEMVDVIREDIETPDDNSLFTRLILL